MSTFVRGPLADAIGRGAPCTTTSRRVRGGPTARVDRPRDRDRDAIAGALGLCDPADSLPGALGRGSAVSARQSPSVVRRHPYEVAHGLTLVAAFVVLLWIDRHQWFNADEWAFILRRGVPGPSNYNLLVPHNEHWTTIPILGYRLLFTVFGVRTYLPYTVVLIIVTLGITHLLWRVLRRIGVSPLLNVVVCALFAVLGVAWQDYTSAFQLTLIGPLLTGLAALLLSPTQGRLGRRDAVVVLLLLAGLMFSGLGVVMVFVVALATALRRGLRAGAAIAVVPAVVYGAWYLKYGRYGTTVGHQPLRTALQAAPGFMWQGFLTAVDGATGLSGIGAVLLVLLAVWVVRRARPTAEPWPLILSTAAGAVLFFFLTALERSGVGLVEAQQSRYTYVVIALLLPAAALALDQLLGTTGLRVPIILLSGLALLLVQLSTLNSHATQSGVLVQERKHRIMAAAVLADDHAAVLSMYVVPNNDPQVSLAELDRLARHGELPGNVVVTPSDVLTAREYLQVVPGGRARVVPSGPPGVVSLRGGSLAPSSRPSCLQVTAESNQPTIELGLAGPTNLQLESDYGGAMPLALVDGANRGRSRVLNLPAGQPQTLSVGEVPAELELTLPPTGATTICRLAP